MLLAVRKRNTHGLVFAGIMVSATWFRVTRADSSKNVITKSIQIFKIRSEIEITYESSGRERKSEEIDRCPKTLIGVGFFDFDFEFIALRT